ncbi:MAG: NAD(P)H-binding protein [candidate division NC10 bacterium]|nr:NAD(P)H-binding protein [candidate division NC10 bacterium]
MILVTGATGFVGRHLVRRLCGAGEAVRCLVRPGSPGLQWLESHPLEVMPGHLLDADALAAACQGSRKIIHLAAPIHEGRDAWVERVHCEGMALLVEGARAARVERLLMVSPLGTGASAGLPFLRSRGRAEDLLRESGLPFVILQSSLMFGLGDRLISGMIRLLTRTGLLLIPGTGKTMLQPIWVGDVVSCLLRALHDEEVLDRTIPIGGPQHLTYEEIADQVGKMLNIPRVKVHLSRRAVAWATRLLEGLGLNPFLGYRHLELLEVGTITALDAVRRSFGFQPMPLIEGVAYHLVPRREMGAPRPPSGAERGSRTRDQR